MVKVAYIKNPLNRSDIERFDVKNGTKLSEIIPSDGKYIVSVNGKNIDTLDVVLIDGMQVIYTPVIEKHAIDDVFGFFVAAAIAVFAPGIGGAIASSLGFASTGIAASLITAGVVVGGLAVVNALMPVQTPNIGSLSAESFDTSPTYGWNGIQTSAQIGRPIPILYGIYKVGGVLIRYDVDTKDLETETLYMELVLCEGEIEPFWYTDVWINDIPLSNIKEGYMQYKLGTRDQQPFGYDKEAITYADYSLSRHYGAYVSDNVVGSTVKYGEPVQVQTQSNDIDYITVKVSFPYGLYHINDNGGVDNKTVKLKIYYKKTTDTDWQTFEKMERVVTGTEYEWQNCDGYFYECDVQWSTTSPGSGYYQTGRTRPIYSWQLSDELTISANLVKKIEQSYTFPVENGYQYDIKIEKLTDDQETTRDRNTMVFDSYEEGTNYYLSHPYIAKMFLSINATENLNGSINSIKALIKRKSIDVYDSTGAFYHTFRSDNPAWVIWDLLTNKRYGAGIDYSDIDFDSFVHFSEWCSETVTFEYNGETITAPRARFNANIDFQMDLWSLISAVAMVGRAIVTLKGSKYSIIIDEPKEPVQIFSMGNIKAGSYNTTYIGESDSANIIEAKYYDREKDYQPSFIEYSENPNEYKKATINMLGVTEAQHAYRLARYFYWTTKYQRRVVEFDVGIDALACELGDVVYFAHDVPAWGHSGRVLSWTSTTEIEIDEPVYIDTSKTYSILIRFNDDTIEKHTVDVTKYSESGETTTVYLSDEVTGTPSGYEVYIFGETNKEYELLKITGITRGTDGSFHIVAVDYKEDILDDDGVVLSEQSIASLSYGNVENIIISEHLEKRKDGTVIGYVDLSWENTQKNIDTKYNIYVKLPNSENYSEIATNVTGNSFSFNAWFIPEDIEVEFKIQIVTAGWKQSISDASSITYTYIGKSAPPSDVAGLTLSLDSELGIKASWNAVTDVDLQGYNVYVNGTLFVDKYTSTSIYISPVNQSNMTIEVESIDTSGNVSVNKTSESIAVNFYDVTSIGIVSSKDKLKLSIGNYNSGSFNIDYYKFVIGDYIFKSKQPEIFIDGLVAGDYEYSAYVVDIFGNEGGCSVTQTATIQKPSTPEISWKINGHMVEFSIDSCGRTTYDIDYIEITDVQTGTIYQTKEEKWLINIDNYDNYQYDFICVDVVGNRSDKTTKTIGINVPTVNDISYSFIGDKVNIKWSANSTNTFGIEKFVVTKNTNSYTTYNNEIILPADWLGSETIIITPYDTNGKAGTSSSIAVEINAPSSPTLNSYIDGTEFVIEWNKPSSSLDISHYIVEYDDISIKADSQVFRTLVTWLSKTFKVYAVDIAGNNGEITNVTSDITVGEITQLSAQVIENNVILKWEIQEGTLPFEIAIIKKGDDVDTAEIIGTKKGTFTVVFESSGGEYTYWACPIDTAGNKGVCKNVTVNVSQPPNYILNVEWHDDFSGTKTNAYYSEKTNVLWAPINTAETYQEHFDNRSWTSPQDQIDAGYSIWSEPYPTSAEYSNQFDYGQVLNGSLITVEKTIQNQVGSVNIQCYISYSEDGTNWSDEENQWSIYATNFRYVKIRLTFTGDEKSVVGLNKLIVRLDSKEIKDSGMNNVNSSDTNGTWITFNKQFLDVKSITVTPQGSSSLTAVYDFEDVPNPTGFYVYLFDSNGNRIDGQVSWFATGY